MGGYKCKKMYDIVINHIDDEDLFQISDLIKMKCEESWKNDYCLKILYRICHDNVSYDFWVKSQLKYFIFRYEMCDGNQS